MLAMQYFHYSSWAEIYPSLFPHLCIFVVFVVYFDTILFYTQALHMRLLQRVLKYPWGLNNKNTIRQSFGGEWKIRSQNVFYLNNLWF